jgi:PAS domain S-box-containing protein
LDQQYNLGAPQSDEDRYRLLVDAITDYAIYMIDPTGTVVSWNSGAERCKGYDASEIIGEHFSRFYSEEDRASGEPAKALAIAAAQGRFEKEGWRIRKGGERFWAHVIIDPIRAPSGEILGFAKVTRDLTERRRAEQSLRRSEEQFRLLVQGVTDYAIYLLDPAGRVISWNPGAQRIKGYRPEEIIGRHFSEFYTPEDRAAEAPAVALARALAEGRFEKEGWRLRKDGTRFWAHVVIDPVHDEDGSMIGFAKITRDVTERREAQRALDQTREALFQSQKLDAIGRLTGGVAHDFNNLLMVVLGSLELIRKRVTEDPKITPLIDNAIEGAQRGAVLTQRMLAFARKQDLKTQAVRLPGLVEGVTAMLEGALGPSIRIETEMPADLPDLSADPNQLEAVLLNLVLNARDAMPEGGVVRIAARAERLAAREGLGAGAYVRLSVADTGQGMDAETMARATEPFYTTKGVGKGAGLGLSMAHGLMEQLGGRLTLHSERDKGTVVELLLPQAHPDDERPASANSPRMAAPKSFRPLSILAVDDDSLVLMNTVAMLEDLGHRVVAASSATAALAALERETVQLVITDYAMPEVTGLQLADTIRTRHPDLPVILATGYASVALDSEPDLPRLSKPFGLREVSAAIREATGDDPPTAP